MNSDLIMGTLTQSMIRSLGMPDGFLRMGGCPYFGTEPCTTCPLAAHVPCQLCDPPDECPDCPRREECPCGCAETRRALQIELGIDLLAESEQEPVAIEDSGGMCMVPDVCRQMSISDYTVYKLISAGRITCARRYMPGTRRLAWYVSVAEVAYYNSLNMAERQRLAEGRWTVRELMSSQ